MTKKVTKKEKQLEDSAPHDDYHEKENRVYVFNNVLFNFNMYVNADSADEACEKFDQCGFAHRDQWKIMVELSHQPSEGSHGK